jgi:diguanylate cyclase (GGDEF)-like protein/PAS domain S-box-containing protein
MFLLLRRSKGKVHRPSAAAISGSLSCSSILFVFQTGARSNLHPVHIMANETAFIRVAWCIWLALSLSAALALYLSRKEIPARWLGAALTLLLLIEMFLYELIAKSSTHSPLLNKVLEAALCSTAFFFASSLFFLGRRLAATSAEAARAQESERRLITAAETSTDAVFMYECVRNPTGEIIDFKFTFLNRTAERLIGADREHAIGKNLYGVFPSLRSTERFSIYKSVVETGEPARLELTHPIFKSGDLPARYNIQVSKLQDGIIMTMTDITLRAQYKEELQQALSFNKSVVASSPFSIVVTDINGLITCINPAAERLLSYQEAELLGQPCTILHDTYEIQHRSEELSAQFGIDVYPDHHVFSLTPEQGLIDEREWTYIRKDGSGVPVQLVVTALRDASERITGFLGISYDLTERKRADEYIYHVAHHDPLTGLPTRTLLRDRLEVAIERARRSQDNLAVMMVDLDNFKRVNDSLGHQAGDTVLCEISRRLKACVRKSDTIARMGGDEFVVLLADLRSHSDAHEICQKLLSAVVQPIQIGRHEIIVTASIGIGLFPGCDDVDSLFKNADLAMYNVKARGRNGSEIYTPELAMQGLEELQMESALRNALEAKEFEIVYQPQISFADHKMLGVEALLRWNSRVFGPVAPDIFIPIAEEIGLIVPIGEWILVEACREVAVLQTKLGIQCSVAVNISPRQFQQKDFPATVERALYLSGLKAHQLELEITEQLLMVDSEESLEIMQRVRTLGVRFAIDDFGTGFSNMGYITRFAVDRIKIDRSFISRCDTDETSRAVTSAIIALAHSLNIEVIAEGVESENHVRMLTQMSCDQAQGYFYSRPLRSNDLDIFALGFLRESISSSDYESILKRLPQQSALTSLART